MIKALVSGAAGALSLTVLHQLLKRITENPPRMDKLGEEALTKLIDKAGAKPPPENVLYRFTLGGDIAGNALYYALIATAPKASIILGATLGAAAGVGAVTMPEKLGLNENYSGKTCETKLLTIGLYTAGGIVAGAVYKMLTTRSQ